MTGNLASSPLSSSSTDLLPTSIILDVCHTFTATIPTFTFSNHGDLIAEKDLSRPYPVGVDDEIWNFDLNEMFDFDHFNDIDFSYIGPSMSSFIPVDLSQAMFTAPTTCYSATLDSSIHTTSFAASIPPAASIPSTASVPAAASVPSTVSTVSIPPTAFTASIPPTALTASIPPTAPTASISPTAPTASVPPPTPAMSIAPAKPGVILLNDDIVYHPPYHPPLVPHFPESSHTSGSTTFLKSSSLFVLTTDNSDSDTAAANLFTKLNLMKCKTPTLEVSSKETDTKS